ncbi:MAG: LysR family transcriptional regulator, partial [Oscillospiraceae bacterium]|nr:LysR family transcriptional regulator [Oscillospiraceae bacterium]
MTFSQLNYVLEISRCGSINKAASKLFVSQSSLSNSIQELEKELDITIFVRSTKGIELTPEG